MGDVNIWGVEHLDLLVLWTSVVVVLVVSTSLTSSSASLAASSTSLTSTALVATSLLEVVSVLGLLVLVDLGANHADHVNDLVLLSLFLLLLDVIDWLPEVDLKWSTTSTESVAVTVKLNASLGLFDGGIAYKTLLSLTLSWVNKFK